MGDTTDGSSNAAQGAQQGEDDEASKGFFERLFDAFGASESQDDAEGASAMAVRPPNISPATVAISALPVFMANPFSCHSA